MNYLRWIGGKSGIANLIIPYFPKNINKYIEPFCGSLAMFLSYKERLEKEDDLYEASTPPFEYILCDINEPLLNCHSSVKYNLEHILALLKNYETRHNENSLGTYLAERNMVSDVDINDSAGSAARFLYVNKICFNGIWRVNRSGKFNVPWNKMEKVAFDDVSLRMSQKLMDKTSFYIRDFRVSIREFAKKGDFVYLDPPYFPLSKTSSFTSYNKNVIDDKELLYQIREECEWMDSQGVKWLMSNSSAKEVYDAFKRYRIADIQAPRFVKALKNGEKRESVTETVIKNY